MGVNQLMEYSLKNFNFIRQVIEPLQLLEIDSFHLIRLNDKHEMFLLTEDIAAQSTFFEHKLFQNFHAFTHPIYIQDGDYLCPLSQLYDNDAHHTHNQLFNCISSAVWLRKDQDVLDIYFFGSSSKLIAYENLYQVLLCYIQNLENNHSIIYQQKLVNMSDLLGWHLYKKSKVISTIQRHQRLEKNLISHICLNPKEKDFLLEFMQSWSYKELAQKLNMTERSIYNYLNRLKSRFSVDKVSDLKSYLREYMLL